VADVDAEVRRLEALGARRIDVGQGDEADFVSMADPEATSLRVPRRTTGPLRGVGHQDFFEASIVARDSDVGDAETVRSRTGSFETGPLYSLR
jgi:hypothetical protein